MSTPNGYNNPAFCHQFDTSLYDYEYVPEIDPDSPEVNQRQIRQDTKLVRPRYLEEFSGTSDEFENSSDSNKSIIVEECNNRRITLICERRKPDGGNAGYHQEVCLESERAPEVPQRSDRHQRRLEPPRESTDSAMIFPRMHRYEEIPPPPYSRSVHRYAEICPDENGYPSMEQEVEVESASYPQSFSPNFSPSRTYQRTISPHPPELCHFRPSSPSYTSSPRQQPIEMSELSPPRAVTRTPKRSKHSPERFIVAKSTPRRKEKFVEVCNPSPKSKIFQMKKSSTPKEKNAHPIRRNISNSFPEERSSPFKKQNPYRPTTKEVPSSKTAIITPIFQRKKELFKSTGNILQRPVEQTIIGVDGKVYQISEKFESKLRRNQSVPNFVESQKKEHHQSTPKKSTSIRKLDYQYSPAKSIDRFSPIDRSRISLIDRSKSWSNFGNDFRSPPTGCLSVAAIVQIITGFASCGISFYLLSKIGRRYYLDLGVLAAFCSLILGFLGFRAHCWRWFPNRNYVSGYIMLAAFSILTCSGFVFLITARPMAGDPMLDLAGGAICGISVLTIIMAITGLTMSGCCKTPPPDNRVTNI